MKRKADLVEDSRHASPLVAVFVEYRKALDSQNDQRERVVKLSRDLTVQSKRMIFSLARSAGTDHSAVLKEHSQGIQTIFDKLVKEVDDSSYWRLRPAFSPGLQEFVEALALYHVLSGGALPSPSDVEAQFSLPAGMLSPEDFLLGLADVTGELMRIVVRLSADVNNYTTCLAHLSIVESLHAVYEGIPARKPFADKAAQVAENLKKVNQACLDMKVRHDEIRLASLPLAVAPLQPLSS